MHWSELVLHDAPHLRLIGPTSSGKTMIAEVLAAKVDGQIVVLDPVYDKKHWGGLPAVTVAHDGSFAPIEAALKGLMAEMARRTARLQEGGEDFPRLTVFWDEVPNTIAELKDAGDFLRRIGNAGRHVNMHLVGMGQSALVHSWGISGYGDTGENFATILLGGKALEVMPELAGSEHPAVLEFNGMHLPIDTSGLLDAAMEARKELAAHPEKVFQVPQEAAQLLSAPPRDRQRKLYRKLRLAFRKKFEAMAPAEPWVGFKPSEHKAGRNGGE